MAEIYIVNDITYAQLVALIGIDGLEEGLHYKITDRNNIALLAITNNTLDHNSQVEYQNSAMSSPVKCQILYDVTTDKIYKVYDPIKNNEVVIKTYIDKFPFDSANKLEDKLESACMKVLISFDLKATKTSKSLLKMFHCKNNSIDHLIRLICCCECIAFKSWIVIQSPYRYWYCKSRSPHKSYPSLFS